ncbi:alcaligin biosynthesis enzyme [Arthrobacter sp. Hiyo4]|nr:alcaligin biosynthesis enzyme [Arthrobacter sp. Hiyo4]
MTSPEYVDYFHRLPQDQRDGLIKSQKNLYKGINSELIDAIYDLLYTKSLSGMVDTQLLTHSSLTGAAWDQATGSHTLQLRHEEQGSDYVLDSEAVVLATGYTYREPEFLAGIQERIARDTAGRFAVARNYSTGVEPAKFSSRTPNCTRMVLSPRTWAWPPIATRASCAKSPAARSIRWSAASRSSSSARRMAWPNPPEHSQPRRPGCPHELHVPLC